MRFPFDIELFLPYNNNMPNETDYKYSWNPVKRRENIEKRRLDMVKLADGIFADPNVVIELDDREDYGEERFLAYGMTDGLHLCLCFTLRADLIHLITIFKVKDKIWRKHYEQ
jgi:uncharacterized DUF497 family protein